MLTLASPPALADIFHANLFMAQCGGISVGELNKLEVDLCERLHWRLVPSIGEMRELLEAVQNPQMTFWNGWFNAPRPALQESGISEELAAPDADEASQGQQQQGQQALQTQSAARMPHSKSVGDSISRLFRSGGSEETLADMTTTASTHGKQSGEATEDGNSSSSSSSSSSGHGERRNGTSPRSVMGKTFSFSNLFGLATGW